jgi:hypothetical protein
MVFVFRSVSEIELSGAGMLPTSIQIEPGASSLVQPASPVTEGRSTTPPPSFTQLLVAERCANLSVRCGGAEFLSQPDALERWLDHFDSMKGLPVVIVDLPPSQVTRHRQHW